MELKDDVVSWYVRNVIIPNFVKYDSPGFVITEQKTKYGYTYQRDVFLSEKLISDIELAISQNKNSDGEKFLYQVGKNFGWNYGKSFKVPTISKNKQDDILEVAKFLANFIGGTWAEKTEIVDISVEKKFFEIKFYDYVVCSKNGIGTLLSEGSLAGLWAWMMNDNEINAEQKECQGRSDKNCITTCAPIDYFTQNDKFTNEINEIDCDTEEYRAYNKISKTNFSNMTIRKMISNGLVKYQKGKMEYCGERYFPLGIDFIFLLENEANKESEFSAILYKVAFEHGKKIAQNAKANNFIFLSDFFSIMGWGDVGTMNGGKQIGVTHYPWHPLFNVTYKQIFLGMVSGMVSQIEGTIVNYIISKQEISVGTVMLTLGRR